MNVKSDYDDIRVSPVSSIPSFGFYTIFSGFEQYSFPLPPELTGSFFRHGNGALYLVFFRFKFRAINPFIWGNFKSSRVRFPKLGSITTVLNPGLNLHLV